MAAGSTNLLRPILTIALLPVAPALGVTLGLAIPPPVRDEAFSLSVLTTLAAIGGCTLIWLQLVRWTLNRVLGTSSASAVLLVHLALWHPVWDVGCVNDVLIVGQGLTLLGLWVWLVPLIWWAGIRYRERLGQGAGECAARILKMRGIPMGYLRAMALVPLVCGVYVMFFVLLDEVTGWSDPIIWVLANTLGALVVSLGWVWAWRRGVLWTPLLKRETLVLSLGLVIMCGVSGLIEGPAEWIDSLRINLPLVLVGVFMGLTAWRWAGPGLAKTSAEEDEEGQPYCPACGYNMTGLHQARCPECGRSYTLDELFAANVWIG